jgi:hypothetical protein
MQEMASYQYLAGDATDGFNKSVEHLSRHLGDVRVGGKEAAESFAQFGIDANKQAAMPLDDAVRSLMDHFKGMDNQSEKTALAVHAFGKSGAEVLQIWQKGSSILDDSRAAVERFYGSIYGEGAAEKLREITAENKKLSAAIEGVQLAAASSFGPFLKETAQSLTDLLENPLQRIKEAWQSIVEGRDVAGERMAERANEAAAAVVRRPNDYRLDASVDASNPTGALPLRFTADLRASNEVPAITNVDKDATGTILGRKVRCQLGDYDEALAVEIEDRGRKVRVTLQNFISLATVACGNDAEVLFFENGCHQSQNCRIVICDQDASAFFASVRISHFVNFLFCFKLLLLYNFLPLE